MLPASTCSPPKRFTPSRLEWDSRPFRGLPPAFLCAMSGNPSAGADVRYLDLGERLPMGLLPQVVLATLEFDDADLGAPAVPHHRGDNLPSCQEGFAQGHIGSLAHQEHLAELDGRTRLGIELLDAEDAVL